ncbi:MAG: hypothetical protein ACI9BW_000171 [Gammaproteobacteria bacterium]|jgi:hypothetical protein
MFSTAGTLSSAFGECPVDIIKQLLARLVVRLWSPGGEGLVELGAASEPDRIKTIPGAFR